MTKKEVSCAECPEWENCDVLDVLVDTYGDPDPKSPSWQHVKRIKLRCYRGIVSIPDAETGKSESQEDRIKD